MIFHLPPYTGLRVWRVVLLSLFVIGIVGCSQSFKSRQSLPEKDVWSNAESGVASYYCDSLDGNPTASGETYDKRRFTAAHKSLPFGTKVKVRNVENGKLVSVVINDRGPFVEDRIIDLSSAAAKKLGLLHDGVANVKIAVVSEPNVSN